MGSCYGRVIDFQEVEMMENNGDYGIKGAVISMLDTPGKWEFYKNNRESVCVSARQRDLSKRCRLRIQM